MSNTLLFFSPLIGEKSHKEQKRLLPKQQIELHESLVLNENKLVIVDEAPSSFDNDLIGMMISISFKQNNNAIFIKKEFPGSFFLFDFGRITSVQSDSNNGAIIKVDCGENFGICKVKLFMNDYVPAHIKIPQKSIQWRLLR
jgi:hypothetical protein